MVRPQNSQSKGQVKQEDKDRKKGSNSWTRSAQNIGSMSSFLQQKWDTSQDTKSRQWNVFFHNSGMIKWVETLHMIKGGKKSKKS